MEKPAVIFNEAGFKMFMDLVRDLSMANGGKQIVDTDLEKAKADELVQAYFAREDIPDLSLNKKQPLDEMANAVEKLLIESGKTWTTLELVEALSEMGFVVNSKGMTPTMRGIMMRKPNIQKVGKGEYIYNEA